MGGPSPPYADTFVNDLKTICAANRRLLRFGHVVTAESSGRFVSMVILTRSFRKRPGGLSVNSMEEVLVEVPALPTQPPRVWVTHSRFVGYPHVLQGCNICIYLDPNREWDPLAGASGFVRSLVTWFRSAIAAEFNASTALFHPVGGVIHETPGTPMVVCRQEMILASSVSVVSLERRSAERLDLSIGSGLSVLHVPALLIRIARPLFFGAGSSFGEVLHKVGWGTQREILMRLNLLRHHRSRPKYLYFVLAVAHQEVATYHLLAGRISVNLFNRIPQEHIPIEWCSFSDERPSISRRRDGERPMHSFYEKSVLIVGIGGIGSWIAEFVTRASPKRIFIADYGTVRGGLIVRQNYVDRDVGKKKALALAQRLQSISDASSVEYIADGPEVDLLKEFANDKNSVIIDATANVAFGRVLDSVLVDSNRQGMVAQVVTDTGSGCMGMLVVLAPHSDETILSLDNQAGKIVLSDGNMESYHTFWSPFQDAEIVPTRGCSLPTFHGSAADMAAVAAEHSNLIAQHIGSSISAVHLFALSHSNVSRKHVVYSSESLSRTAGTRKVS